MRGKRSKLDINNNLKRIDNVKKMARHKQELQQCEFYINSLMVQPLNPTQVNEAEKFANKMYEMIQKESPDIAADNTAPMPRNIDPIKNLKLNLQAIHTMLVEIIAKEAKDITEKSST